jgi:hypothetical protein
MRHPYFSVALVLALLIGCASIGFTPARSFDDRLAYAYATHTAVVEVIASAAQSAQLTPPEARQAANLAEQARQVLDGAKALESIDASAAAAKLTLGVAVLTQLQTYLHTRGIK